MRKSTVICATVVLSVAFTMIISSVAQERDREREVRREERQMRGSERGEERLHHMHVAMEHLHAAGLHEIAERVAAEAGEEERRLRAQQRERGGDMVTSHVREMHEQIELLRREVRELQEQMNDRFERLEHSER